jgi:amino acid transporter
MLDYLFYRIHTFYSRSQGKVNGAVLAMVLVCVIIFLNLFTILILLQISRILPIIDITRQDTTISILILFISGYFVFLRKKRYIEIGNRFENETSRERQNGRTKVLLYIFASAIVFVMVSMLGFDMMHGI